jgi:hypothetical protein
MTRDDLVKQLENAEALLELIQAKTNLHIWDMAYAAGAKDEREACAALCSEVAAEKARCAALCSEVAAGRDAEAIEEAILARGKK